MHSLGLLLHDVSRLLKAEFERRSRETGLTLNQWRVLATLSRKGSQTQAALAAAIEVSAIMMAMTQGIGPASRACGSSCDPRSPDRPEKPRAIARAMTGGDFTTGPPGGAGDSAAPRWGRSAAPCRAA